MTVAEIALLMSSAGGIGGVAALISALRNRKDSKAIREQVQNSHGTNLRDDLDRMAKSIERLLDLAVVHDSKITDNGKKVDRGLGEVRQALTLEAEERRRDMDMIHRRVDGLHKDNPF